MNNKCKRLGNHATKAERAEEHRVKMEMKRVRDTFNHEPRHYTLANLSQNHPDYGDQPQEHERKKTVLDSEVE